jgi:hypothetical protein
MAKKILVIKILIKIDIYQNDATCIACWLQTAGAKGGI